VSLSDLAVLCARETSRAFSPWVKPRARDTRLHRAFRQILLGRPKLPVTCLLFWALSFGLGKLTLRGNPLGVDRLPSLTSMLVVLTSLGFGAVSLSAASIAEDWPSIGRESLWGVGPGAQVLARFLSLAPPALVLGAGVGFAYTGWVDIQADRFIDPIGLFCAGLFALYSLVCLALGLAISSLVSGVRSAIYLLMFVMTLLVLLSDVPFSLEELDGAGHLFWALSYTMPSRYGAGAWAAAIGFDPGVDRGWTWHANSTAMTLNLVLLAVLVVVFLTVAVLRVRHEAPRHAQ
jgi:hypothetical protein